MSKISPIKKTSVDVTFPNTGKQCFGEMKEKIAKYYGLDKDPEMLEFVGDAIYDIIDELNSFKLWQFNLIQAADITSVSGTADYAVPADLWRIYSMRKSDDIDYMLTGLPQYKFDVIFQSQNLIEGYPYVRTDFNIYRDGTIKLFPTPDGQYTFQLRYFKIIPKPASDSECFDMPSPFQQMIKHGARGLLAAFVERPAAMQFWHGKYEQQKEDARTSDEDIGDEDLRFLNVEEFTSRHSSYLNPALRPRYWPGFLLTPGGVS